MSTDASDTFNLVRAWEQLKSKKNVLNNEDDTSQVWIENVNDKWFRNYDIVPNPDAEARKYHKAIIVPKDTPSSKRSESEVMFFQYGHCPFHVLNPRGNYAPTVSDKPNGVHFTTEVPDFAKMNIKLTGTDAKNFKPTLAAVQKLREKFARSPHFSAKIDDVNVSAGVDALYPFKRPFVPLKVWNRDHPDAECPEHLFDLPDAVKDKWVSWEADPELYGLRIGQLKSNGRIVKRDPSIFAEPCYVRAAFTVKPYSSTAKKTGLDIHLEELLYIEPGDPLGTTVASGATPTKRKGRQMDDCSDEEEADAGAGRTKHPRLEGDNEDGFDGDLGSMDY